MACYLATLIKFQSTLPREERPVRRYSLPLISVNFNPRSHERSDETYKTLYISDLISIHAPTRGATLLKLAISISLIFQSTLPREERQYFDEPNETPAEFQSTLPREERPFSATIEGLFLDFNPRSHERSD